jgi:hypothetical protein
MFSQLLGKPFIFFQIYETATEEISTVNEYNKSTASINYTYELDHGPDKFVYFWRVGFQSTYDLSYIMTYDPEYRCRDL